MLNYSKKKIILVTASLILVISIFYTIQCNTLKNTISMNADNTIKYLFSQSALHLSNNMEPQLLKVKVETTLTYARDIFYSYYVDFTKSNISEGTLSITQNLINDLERLQIYEKDLETRRKVADFLLKKLDDDELWSSIEIERLIEQDN